MSVDHGIGIATRALDRAVAGRDAQAARRPAAPARHRQEVRPPMRASGSTAASRSACAASSPRSTRSGDTITNVDVRLDLAQTALGRLDRIGRDVKIGGVPVLRHRQQRLDHPRRSPPMPASSEMLGLLNTQAGDRYLFSGRDADQPAVASLEHIMDGDGARAGFKQVVSERKQADLGAIGRRPPGDLGADVDVGAGRGRSAGPLFGFKLSSINSSLTNATSPARPARRRRCRSISPACPTPARPSSSASTLPDGTSETVTLTATTSATPGAERVHHRRRRRRPPPPICRRP